jgi:hypothetical protein
MRTVSNSFGTPGRRPQALALLLGLLLLRARVG